MSDGGEDAKERLNRKLTELTNELRVALPGVQVLFAFLLILPFSQGFEKVTDLQRDVYAFAVGLAALASLLLIAPSAYHRHRHPELEKETLAEKEEMLNAQSRMAMGGLACLMLAMIGALFVVFDVLFDTPAAIATAVAFAVAFGWFWYALPLSRRVAKSR